MNIRWQGTPRRADSKYVSVCSTVRISESTVEKKLRLKAERAVSCRGKKCRYRLHDGAIMKSATFGDPQSKEN